jgi:hypothetical protein
MRLDLTETAARVLGNWLPLVAQSEASAERTLHFRTWSYLRPRPAR